MHAHFRIPIGRVEVCVAANGAVRFSVRSFGCALFYLYVLERMQLWKYGTNCKKVHGEQICDGSKLNERGRCNEKNNITYVMYIVVMRMCSQTEH